MKGLCAALLVTLLLISVAGQARAQTPGVQIFYDLKHLGGTRYEYTYTVVNNSLTHSSYGYDDSASMIEIFFPARGGECEGQQWPFCPDICPSDAVFFSNLTVTDPGKWDPELIYAVPGAWTPPVDALVNLVDAYSYDADGYPIPLEPGHSVAGFSVAFDYTGTGRPGDQQFSLLDIGTYQPYFDGRTQPKPNPLLANAGPDQTVQAGAMVQLDGSNSSPSSNIVSYQWAQLSGPQVTLSEPDVAKPTFTAPSVGPNGASLQFQLTVSDKNGQTAQATCTVTAIFVNQPPVANAGPIQTVKAGDFVTLNGSGSTDPDDGIASYAWQQTDGPTVQLSDPAAVSPTFTAPVAGTGGAALTFKLTVTDKGGLTSNATCVVNVTWVNRPPVANAGSDQTVNAGDLVSLSGSGSTDPDDGIASYAWQPLTGLPVTMSNTSAVNPTFTAPELVPKAGAILTFQLTVTDKGGLKSTATCTVNVQWVDTPPVVSAGSNVFILSKDQNVTTLTGTAADPDGDPLSYTWVEGTTTLASGQIGTDGKAPLNLGTVPLFSLGAHTLTLQVYDGYVTSQSSMILTLENSLPTVSPSGEGTYQLYTPVTLGGQVADYDGDILNYIWSDRMTTLASGTIKTTTGGAPVNLPTFMTSDLKAGVHTITLQASDSTNAPVAKTITVTINDTTAPILAPVANQTILWPPNKTMVPVTIQANASDNSGMPVQLTVAIACNETQKGLAYWTNPVINQSTGVISLSLMADRFGNGPGRQYTITITATDQSGNASTANAKILVPHHKGKN